MNRRGFILATTLLVMTLLTVMLTAAFIMVSAEFRSTGSSYSLARSLSLAQAGLHSYFSSSHSLGTGYDSTSYTFPGGHAQVVARRLRDSTGTARELWVVYATGVDTTQALLSVGGGSRVVASLAYLPGQLPARAAMVAANGMQLSSNGSNPLSGRNSGIGGNWVIGCSTPGDPNQPPQYPPPAGNVLDDTAAIAVDPAGYSGGPVDAGHPVPVGTIETLGSSTAVTDSTFIDWARVVAGDLYPDFTNSLPTPCPGIHPWGDSDHCPYSSYYWNASVTVPSAGFGASRGLLLATGDVTMANGAHWDGIIIAGGRLMVGNPNHSFTIHGMVITGMNCALGACPAANVIKRGTATVIRWDWCYTHAAISGFASLAPIANTYMDTWKTY